jgi:uncharacterized membrane protein YfcA
MANGTNRIAIFLQNVVGVGQLSPGERVMDFPVRIPGGHPGRPAGAVAGAFIAVKLNDQAMKLAIAGVMILVFFLILLKPNRWIHSHEDPSSHPILAAGEWSFSWWASMGGSSRQAWVLFLLTSLVLAGGYRAGQGQCPEALRDPALYAPGPL